MNLIKRLSLAQQFIALLVVSCASLLLVGALGILQMQRLSQAELELFDTTVVPLRQVVDGGRQAAVHFRRMYPYFLKTDAKSRGNP